jgi:hypothetical protein
LNRGLEVKLAFGRVEENGCCATQRLDRFVDERVENLNQKMMQSPCGLDRLGAKLEANLHLGTKRVVERIRGNGGDKGAQGKARYELLLDFTSVTDAEASCVTDAERIRAAMRGHEGIIDELIRKLVCHGSVASFKLLP